MNRNWDPKIWNGLALANAGIRKILDTPLLPGANPFGVANVSNTAVAAKQPAGPNTSSTSPNQSGTSLNGSGVNSET